MEATLCNHSASLHNLENHVGQIVKSLVERPQGSLHSNSETNPRVQLKVVTLRSGQKLESKLPIKKVAQNKPVEQEVEEKGKGKDVASTSYKPRIPYPLRLKK